MGASRPCRRRSCRVVALRARVPRPSAQRLLARAPARPTRQLAQPAVTPCTPAQRLHALLSARAPSPAPARRVAATVVVLQYNTTQPQSQYNPLYCDTNFPQPASIAIHLTILQYNSSLNQPLSSPSVSRHSALSHNIIWAVAQLNFLHQFFFCFLL